MTRSPAARSRRALALLTGATTALALTLGGATAANADDPDTAIANTKPRWLGTATDLGAADDGAAVEARVYLAPRGGVEALKAAAAAVSTPGSATYGKFLTPDQYSSAYGTPADSVQRVRDYLTKQGLTIEGAGPHDRYLTVSGDVRTAKRAFRTAIRRYQRKAESVQAPDGDVKVPRSVASLILTVTGLDTSPHLNTHDDATPAPPPPGFRNARPCSLSYGQVAATYQADFKTPLPQFRGKTLSYAPCGYTGSQYRSAYYGNTKLSGSGVTVGITDAYAAPTIASDANRYATNHGDGAYRQGQLTQVTPNSYRKQKACDPSGWFGEETLDVEAVHAMAPGANIRYYGARSCFDDDFIDTLGTVVDEDVVQLVSNSWGDLEQAETAENVAAYEQVFLQGAMEGISFLYSSGDDGDELAATGVKQATYPASDPYVTAVGGTADAIGANGKFLFQTGWGTVRYSLGTKGQRWVDPTFLYGAGGGTSSLFNRPAYQDGTVDGGARKVPDVGLDADPNTGMLVGETQTFTDGVKYDEYRIGGTSLASPLFAGMTALSFEKAGHPVGLLNPTIYQQKSTAFTDIAGQPDDPGVVRADYVNMEDAAGGLTYTVRTFNEDSSLAVRPGYDEVTGVGSPNKAWLSAVR